MSDDLVTWLRAQLDDDERIAQAAIAAYGGQERWPIKQPRPAPSPPQLLWLDVMDSTAPETMPPGMAAHISTHDPERALAEIDAKRRILNRYEAALSAQTDPEESQLAADYQVAEYDDWVLPLLALPYADRPGYLEEWRP